MASKGDSDSEDYHSAEEEQELSDKMSRLTPDNKMENSSKEKADFVGNLDNRYVSEDVEVKGEKIELSEEQIKELKEQANKLKGLGNEAFKAEDYNKAMELYSEALGIYPPGHCEQEVAICLANRAACHMKLGQHEAVIEDCTKALDLRPDYLKAIVRRAQSNEALEKLEDAFKGPLKLGNTHNIYNIDYKRALELDPSQPAARDAVMRLPEQIKEQHEKLKSEMLSKLKELGDVVLKPFGLSTNNFQMQQDPNTGSYSINFKK